MQAADRDFHRQIDDALRRGDMFALFERTREAIEVFPDDPRRDICRRWRWRGWAIRMPHCGSTSAIGSSEIGTEDAVALKGRLLKDLAVRASGPEQVELFRQSSQAYRQAYQLSDGYFSGINAATTSLLAGDEAEACEMADGNRPAARRRRAPGLFRSGLGRRSNAGVRRGRAGHRAYTPRLAAVRTPRPG